MKAVKMPKGREFVFKASKGGAAVQKYDWDTWFNPDLTKFPGGLVLLEQSDGTKDAKGTVVDVTRKGNYEVDTDAMPPKIKTAARKRYKVVLISRLDGDGQKLKDAIIIKARDMTPDEKTAEDLRRAEEKAEKEAKEKSASNGVPVAPAPVDPNAPVA